MIIYKITCLATNKIYIGQTTGPDERRLERHVNLAMSGEGALLHEAIREHGPGNFIIESIEECDSKEQLNEREIFWISTFNCRAPNGYNLSPGGDQVGGWNKGLSREAYKEIKKIRKLNG